MFATITTIIATIIAFTDAAPESHRVKHLPNAPKLESRHYSGYIKATESKKLHYYFVESLGPEPSTAPLLVWLNGGPGCSSLDGFLYEHGPYRVNVRTIVNDDGTTEEEAYLTPFPQSWAYLANMLYIESPVGVGFSYSTSPTLSGRVSDYNCTDDTTAEDNLKALHSWYDLFPEYASNELHITGESYGGVYVPTLAESILLDPTFPAKLKGIAVGNGCSGTEVGICSWGDQGSALSAKYLTSTGFLPESLKDSISNNCDYESWFNGDGVSTECVDDINSLNDYTRGLDTYCVYCDCPPASSHLHSRVLGSSHLLRSKVPSGRRRAPEVETKACINTYEASMYLNREDVQEAIHVEEANVKEWEVCHTAEGWDYTSTRPNLPRDTYPLLVSNLDVLIYNGDFDACVPYTDGEMWTSGMNYTLRSPWHAWETEGGDVGGYATGYEVDGKFDFVTVKGGRHEVPETEPVKAFEMIRRHLDGTGF